MLPTFMSAARNNLYVEHRNAEEEKTRFLWHRLAIFPSLILLTGSLSRIYALTAN